MYILDKSTKKLVITRQGMKFNPYLTPYIKTNSNESKTSNYKTLRKKKVAENLHDPGFGEDFSDVMPKAQGTK